MFDDMICCRSRLRPAVVKAEHQVNNLGPLLDCPGPVFAFSLLLHSLLLISMSSLSVCVSLSFCLCPSLPLSLSVSLSLSCLLACLLRGLGTSRWPEGRPPPRSAVVRGEAPIRGGEFVPLSVPVETPPNNTPPEPSRLKPRLGSTQVIRDSQKSQLCTATPSSLDQDDSSGVKLGSSLS